MIKSGSADRIDQSDRSNLVDDVTSGEGVDVLQHGLQLGEEEASARGRALEVPDGRLVGAVHLSECTGGVRRIETI